MTDNVTRLPAGVRHLRCANPGPLTLTGTNTYVIDLGGDVAVIDPGPDDSAHRDATVASVERFEGATRVVVLLTHHHDDHEGGAQALVDALVARRLSVELRGGAHGKALADGEMIGTLQAVRVPGHTADSVAFMMDRGGTSVLFSGDTLLGEGSSFVAYPDGDLTAYLASLDVLAGLVELRDDVVLAPGHGSVGASAATVIERYREHRQERLEEVRSALANIDARANGDELVAAVVSAVYSDIGPELRPAVEAVVKAQLAHLGRL